MCVCGGGGALFFCLFFKYGTCLVLGRMSEDTEEILPCSIISNRLLISEMEDWDYRRILKVFELDNPASHESDLLFSDI